MSAVASRLGNGRPQPPRRSRAQRAHGRSRRDHPDDAGGDRRQRRHRRRARDVVGVHLRGASRRHDRRRGLPGDLRYGRPDSADDDRRRAGRSRDRDLSRGVRADRARRFARLVRVCIANLAGVPSIVFGLFGLGFFISTVGKGIDAAAYGGQVTYAKPSLDLGFVDPRRCSLCPSSSWRPRRLFAPCRARCATPAWRSAQRSSRRSCGSCCLRRRAGS